VNISKGIDHDNGSRITVTPRFNLETDDKDVVVTCSNDKTDLKLTASANNQEVILSQKVDTDNFFYSYREQQW
jgi:hypothetical protein